MIHRVVIKKSRTHPLIATTLHLGINVQRSGSRTAIYCSIDLRTLLPAIEAKWHEGHKVALKLLLLHHLVNLVDQADIYGKNPSQRASERAKDSKEITGKYFCTTPLLALNADPIKQSIRVKLHRTQPQP